MERVNVLGVGVSAINMRMALDTVDHWIEEREPSYITITGVHGVMESQRDEKIRLIHNQAGMVTPDGMPLVWLSRMAGFRHVERVYGPDLMLALCQHSLNRSYRHYFYGGAPEIPGLLSQKLTRQFPGLEVVGAYSPPFKQMTDAEDDEIVQMINEADPDIVWVGLSTPKQELWMASHLGKLNAPVMIGVGAAFDFNAGVKRQAPRWMQKNGLEWFFRLSTEPRRLAKRYLINNPVFVLLVLGQTFRLRRYVIT